MTKKLDDGALRLAVHEIAGHPDVHDLVYVAEGKGARVTFWLDLGFGSRWRADGASPTGVLPRESIQMKFSPSFPERAPAITLRPDFSRDHPHIQPWLENDRVVPCLVDGKISEFLAARGLYAVVEQLKVWLLKAAVGRLLDPTQGWETARRDDVDDYLVADPEMLRGLVTRTGGFQFFELEYAMLADGRELGTFYGRLGGRTNVQTRFSASKGADGKWGFGSGLALAVWPGKTAGGELVIADRYLPEDVVDAASLWRRARELGVEDPLKSAVALLRNSRRDRASARYPMPVILLVRRPYPLIGAANNIELCPYLVPLTMPDAMLSADSQEVRPLGHRDDLSPALLRRLSGTAAGWRWALLGCGSLGSKIAFHGARAGTGPALVVDPASLSPHNAARHALYPTGGSIVGAWRGEKAEALAGALEPLSGKVEAVVGNHSDLNSALRDRFDKAARPTLILNASASIVAREHLCGPQGASLPQCVEALLFGGGALGALAVEGVNRNPDACEIFGALYTAAQDRPELAQLLFDPQALSRVDIGQGCGSMTMTMSDATLSVMAALLGERFLQIAASAGEAGVELFARSASGINHERLPVSPCVRLPLEGLEGWSVSLSAPVQTRIERERAHYQTVETGGVCLGWSSSIARRLYVTDFLDAPRDSIRSASEFVLGVEGLTAAVEDVARKTSGAITCVGTWHSHLGSPTPSGRDRASAKWVGAAELRPMAFVICGRNGWRAISASAPK